MQRMPGGSSRSGQCKSGPARFVRLSARESGTVELLRGCVVVSAGGERIGTVEHLMVDARTRRLRYVLLSRRGGGAMIALPWHALYFDAALARLVFYTLV
jgi:hypothetical protein